MDFQDVDEKSFSSWEDCICIYEQSSQTKKKPHRTAPLGNQDGEREQKEHKREQKIIRGRHAYDLKNPERWASLGHAGCSYHLWATRNQG